MVQAFAVCATRNRANDFPIAGGKRSTELQHHVGSFLYEFIQKIWYGRCFVLLAEHFANFTKENISVLLGADDGIF